MRQGELAAEDGSGELAGEAVMKQAETANGDCLEEIHGEGASFY